MREIIEEYLELSKDGTEKNRKSERLLNELYVSYIDKIIDGIIKKYSFHRMGDYDEIMNIGRYHIWLSICKRQYNPDGASMFTFYSTVAARNIMNFTLNQNRKKKRTNTFKDINEMDENGSVYLASNFDFDKDIVIEEIYAKVLEYFKDEDPRLYRLAEIFVEYMSMKKGEKLIKIRFIEYAQTQPEAFSPSYVNKFFSMLKNIKAVKNLLQEAEIDMAIIQAGTRENINIELGE